MLLGRAVQERRTPRRRIAVGALLTSSIALAGIGTYAWRLLAMSRSEVLRSDYLSQQVGGILWRIGKGAQLYVDQLQGPVYSSLAAGDHGGDLLFNHAPLSAVLAAPFSGLDPVAGHLAWSIYQFLLLTAGCLLVARAAAWTPGTPRLVRVAAVLAGLAGSGTLSLLLEGQGDGELALALGAAFLLWRRDRLGAGAAVLVFGAGVAKPHLALGLVALLVGWRDRRLLAGALGGGLAVVGASLLAVGWSGGIGFVTTLIRSGGLWPHAQFLGFTGFFSSVLGDGAPATVISGVCGLAALALAWRLGAAVRADRGRLLPALAGATALSLVLSPHLLGADLVVLAPMLVASLAGGPPARWPTLRSWRILQLWLLLTIAAGLDAAVALPAMFGRLTTVVLVVIAAVGWRAALPRAVSERRESEASHRHEHDDREQEHVGRSVLGLAPR